VQGGAHPLPEGAEAGVQEDFILNVELTLHNASSLAPQLLANGTLINGAHQWSDCVYNSTHRRRVSPTPCARLKFIAPADHQRMLAPRRFIRRRRPG